LEKIIGILKHAGKVVKIFSSIREAQCIYLPAKIPGH
jgi:hypothetical protein